MEIKNYSRICSNPLLLEGFGDVGADPAEQRRHLEKSNLLLSLCKIYGQTRRKPATQSYGALRASQLSTADSRHSPWFHSSALTPPKVLMRMMLRQVPKNRIGQDRASGVRCFTLSAEYKAKALSGMGKTMP